MFVDDLQLQQHGDQPVSGIVWIAFGFVNGLGQPSHKFAQTER